MYLLWASQTPIQEVRPAGFAHCLSLGGWPFPRSHAHMKMTSKDAYSLWGLIKPRTLIPLGKILKKYLIPHLHWDPIQVHLLPLPPLSSSLLSTDLESVKLINLPYTDQHLRVNFLRTQSRKVLSVLLFCLFCFVLFCSTWITLPLESFRGQ